MDGRISESSDSAVLAFSLSSGVTEWIRRVDFFWIGIVLSIFADIGISKQVLESLSHSRRSEENSEIAICGILLAMRGDREERKCKEEERVSIEAEERKRFAS